MSGAWQGREEVRVQVEGRQYLRLLRRNWVVIGLVMLLSVGVGAVAFLNAASEYRAEFSFLVTVPQGKPDPSQAYQGDLLAQQRAPTYAQLVTSAPVIDRVRSVTGSEQSIQELQQQFTTALAEGSTLIQVAANASTAKESVKLAEAMAQVYPDYVQNLQDATGAASTVSVQSPPESARQVAPLRSRYLALAILAGLLLSVVAVAVRETQSKLIRDVDDVRSVSGSGIVVVQSQREGLPDELTPFLADSVARDHVILALGLGRAETWGSHVFHLATTIAELGKPVVMIDLDQQAHALTSAAGLTWADGLHEFLNRGAGLQQVTHEVGSADLAMIPVGHGSLSAAQVQDRRVVQLIDEARSVAQPLVSLGSPPPSGLFRVPDISDMDVIIVVERRRASKAELLAAIRVLEVSGHPARAVLLVKRRIRRRG